MIDAKLEESLAEELPGAIATPANLAELDSIPRLVDEVEARLGPLDVLMNNAAHCEHPDTYDSLTAGGADPASGRRARAVTVVP